MTGPHALVGALMAASVLLAANASEALGPITCMMPKVEEGQVPTVSIPEDANDDLVTMCVKEFLHNNWPVNRIAGTLYRREPKDVAWEKVEKAQSNLAIVDVEREQGRISRVLGIAPALTGKMIPGEWPELIREESWSEVGRLVVVREKGGKLVGQVDGDPKYWNMLGRLRARALEAGASSAMGDVAGQHFHLLWIGCK